MANKKQNRKDGTISSAGTKFPAPITSNNAPTSDLNYTGKDEIHKKSKSNSLK